MKTEYVMFYASYYEATKDLPKEQRHEIYDAIFEYSFNEVEPKLNGVQKMVWTLIKPQIDANIRNYLSGKKGGRPKKNKANKKPPLKTPLSNQCLIPLLETHTETKSKIKSNIKKEEEKEDKNISKEITTYGNSEINDVLDLLKECIGIDQFKETQQMQRNYGKHISNLLKKIGKQEFRARLEGILSEEFKQKNCNSLKYLYGEMKSYIHTPKISTSTRCKLR